MFHIWACKAISCLTKQLTANFVLKTNQLIERMVEAVLCEMRMSLIIPFIVINPKYTSSNIKAPAASTVRQSF